MSLMVGEKDGGGVEAVRVDEEGRIATGADAAAEELASTVYTAEPTAEDPAQAVIFRGPQQVISTPAPGFTATATPPLDAVAEFVRIAGVSHEEVGEGKGLVTKSYQGGDWTANQGGEGVIDRPWPMILSDGAAQTGTESSPLVARIPRYGTTTFGQTRVAQREAMFENVQEYAIDMRQWGTATANGGAVTFNATTGETVLSVTGASGSRAVLQTHTHFPYEPGAVTHPIFTVAHADLGQTNQRRRWGFFNTLDGLYIELLGTDLRLVRRTSTSGAAVDSVIAERAAWFDPYEEMLITNGQRYEIDLQWLSFGVVRFWANGRLLHQVDFANASGVPYMRTAQLPLRFEIENVGASAPSSMTYVCSAVYLDGGTPIRYVPGKWTLSASKTAIGTTFTPVLGLRMAQLLSGRANRKIVIPAISKVANASGRGTVRLYLNPTSVTGGTWTSIPESPWVEYNEGITAITGGTVMSEAFLPNAADAADLNGLFAFALNGTHLRRTFDNADGDVIVFSAAASLGNIDIVSLLATFLTLG